MVNSSIENTLASGFDPEALMKVELDNQERFASLSAPLYAGGNPNAMFTPIAEFVPKQLVTDDLLFSSRNNVKLYDLLGSKDPEKVQLGFDYINKAGQNNDALKYGIGDYVFKTNPTIEKLRKKGYGYNITSDQVSNEDNAYKQEKDSHWWITNAAGALGTGLLKLPGEVLIKAGSIGAKAAAVFDHIYYDQGDKNLLTSMADNVFVRAMAEMDESYKKNFLPTLQTSDYSKAGFFSKMTYGQFWTDDAVDFTAYMLASRGLGGFVSKAIGGIGKGAAATSFMGVTNKLLNAGATGKVGKFLEFVTGAKNVSGIAAYAANIANEAADESIGQYKKIKEDLAGTINPSTGSAYTIGEIQQRASDGAALTFKANLAILALSGGLENKWIQRAIGKESIERGLKDIVINDVLKATEKQFSNKFLQKVASNRIGNSFLYYGPEIGMALLKEGYWEENGQTAATRLADQKFGKGYYDRQTEKGTFVDGIEQSGNSFVDFFKQLGKQTADASTWLGGKGDNEVSTSIGIGGLIGLGGTVASNKIALKKIYNKDTDAYNFKVFKSDRRAEQDAKLDRIKKINDATENFLSFKDAFKPDGKIDKELLMAKSIKMQDISTRLDAIDSITNPVIKQDLKERLFSEYMLAHFSNGTYDQFKKQFSNRSSDELTALGFSSELIDEPGKYIELADQFKNIFDNTSALQFGNSANLKPEQFDNFESLLKSRIYQLSAQSQVNQNTVNRLNTHMSDTYGTFYKNFIYYDNMYNMLEELGKKKDTDGSLETQKQVLRDQMKDTQDDITTDQERIIKEKGENVLDTFLDDFHQFENTKEFQKKLNLQIDKYMSDKEKSVEIFRDEYKKNLTETPEEETVIPDTGTAEPGPVETDPETGEPVVTDAVETDPETGEPVEKEPAKDAGGAPVVLTQEEKDKLRTEKVLERIRVKIDAKIKGFTDKKELEDYYNSLTTEQQLQHAKAYNEQLSNLNIDPEALSTDEEVIMEYPNSDVPFETILKTSSQDSNNRKENNYEEDLIDNEYNLFRNKFIATTKIQTDLIDKGYYFVLELDDFTKGNIGNLDAVTFAEKASVVIVLKDSEGNSVPISDFFSDEFSAVKDKSIQFNIDRKMLNGETSGKWKEMAIIRMKREKIPIDESLKLYKDEATQLNSAIERALNGNPVILKATITTTPTLQAKIPGTQSLDYRNLTDVSEVAIDTGTRQARVVLKSGIELLAYPTKVSTATELFLEVKKILAIEYDTKEEALQIRKNFLHIVFRNTIERYFEIQEKNGKFVIVPIIIKDGNKTEDTQVLSGDRPINISRKGLAGQMVFNGQPISRAEYINLIKNSFVTAQKIVYNKDGSQYNGEVSSYLEYKINDPAIVDLAEQEKNDVEKLVSDTRKLFTIKQFFPVGSLYFDKLKKFFRRVTSLKESPQEVYGTAAANRGTLIDDLFRDFLAAKTVPDRLEFEKTFTIAKNKMNIFSLENFSKDFYQSLYDTFLTFKNHNPNFVYISDIPTLYGTIQGQNFAGTVDILAIDKRNGDLHIIDLKSATRSRIENYANKGAFYSGDKIQLNAYAELVFQMTGKRVKGIYTFPIQLTTKSKSKTDRETNQEKGILETYESVAIEPGVLLQIEREDINSLVKVEPIEPSSKYNILFEGDLLIRGEVIPKDKVYALYPTLNNYMKDFFIRIQNYRSSRLGVPPSMDYLNYISQLYGITFNSAKDRKTIIDYAESFILKKVPGFKGKLVEQEVDLNLNSTNPNFEEIHREVDPSYKETPAAPIVPEPVVPDPIALVVPTLPIIVPNPNPPAPKASKAKPSKTKPSTPRPKRSKKGSNIASFNFSGMDVTFNEVSGEIIINGDIDNSITREILSQLFTHYDKLKGPREFIKREIIRTKKGDIEVYAINASNIDKSLLIKTSFIYDSQNKYIGDLNDLVIEGGILIDKADFIDNITKSDILNAQGLNC